MPPSVLDDAGRLFARGRHSAVISLLESRLPLFRDSHRYYYLLGASCLRTGDVGGATTYLRRAEQLDPRDGDTKLCLAALHLRRGETDKAVAAYLQVLEDRPRDRVARRSLESLRRSDVHERIGTIVSGREFEAFLPGPRRLPPWVKAASAALLAAALVAAAWPSLLALADSLARRAAPRQDVASVLLDGTERSKPVAAAGGSRYILTEGQALAAFDRAKALFQEYRDNAARVEINRLVDSNAAASVKEKARTLLSFAAAPDWRSLRDIPSFAQVAADPGLYRGCAVIWKGRSANLGREGSSRAFDFLAGYADRKRLDGIVKVSLPDPSMSVPAEAPFELLAEIVAAAPGFSLKAIALHELRD